MAGLLDGAASPATVRNEMAALFDQGLLEQPHTSAGRIPSHLGYRLYLDELMRARPLTDGEKQEIEALFNLRDPDPDRLLEDAAKALWKAGIYAETGMGCTGPLVMMSEANLAKAQEILKAAGYIG